MDVVDLQVANILNGANKRFYAENAASFSATRAGGWPGWGRLIEEMYGAGCAWADTQRAGTCAAERAFGVRVVDVACGNLRFERWLSDTLPEVAFDVVALDGCKQLVDAAQGVGRLEDVEFHACDLVEGLVAPARERDGAYAQRDAIRKEASERQEVPSWAEDLQGTGDLVVSFGFAHHVPGAQSRERLMRTLVECARPGGYVALSLWRFADDDALRAKAQKTTQEGLFAEGLDPSALDEGDYLLGWQDTTGSYRYCHSFADDEIDGLVECALDVARLVSRFRADGRTGTLNEYLLFQRVLDFSADECKE